MADERSPETLASYAERVREFSQELQASEGLTKLAAEMLADPDGSLVKLQKAAPQAPDPRHGVDWALTAD